MKVIRGIVDPQVELKLSETKDKSLVDGVSIIGVMEGNFFVPDGISRNKRFYSKSLWSRTLSNESVKDKLANRGMYGTIGHDTPVNDESFAKGLLTHITDKLYIDEKGQGIGRALILNTTAGRNLKTVLGAGGKVYVSSRALGTFEGKTKHGVPKVKEEDYDLQGFDAVLDPGFLEANPTLKESLEYPDEGFRGMINECYSILEEKTEDSGKVIDEEIVEVISEIKEIKNKQEKLDMDLLETVKTMTVENTQLKSAVAEALKGQEKADADNSVLQSENESLRKQLQEQEDAIAKKKKDDEEEDDMEKKDAKAKEEAATSILKTIRTFMEQDEEGDKEDDDEDEKKKKEKEAAALEAFKKFTEEVGTSKQVQDALSTLEAKLDAYKAFEEEFGTNEEIQKLLTDYETLGEKQVSTAKESASEKLATELSIPKEKVEALLAKGFDEDAVKEFFKDIKESIKVKQKYGRSKVDESKEDNDERNPFKKSIGERVLGGMRFGYDETDDTKIDENKSFGESLLDQIV